MTAPTPSPADRRPLRSRSWPLFIAIARQLAAWRIAPNAISIAGMIAAVIAGGAIAAAFRVGGEHSDLTGRSLLILAAALFQFRLICNLLDGMVAVEGKLGSPAGELYNDVPDRVADSAALIGAGYAVSSSPELGYFAALIAVMTAYIRAVGKGAGAGADFSGLMDKKRRMFVMTLACVALAFAPRSIDHAITIADHTLSPWTVALALIAVGSLITCLTRLRNIARKLNALPPMP